MLSEKKQDSKAYDPALAGFPATESAKMIDKLFVDIIPRALSVGRLKPNPDLALAMELVADFKATIDSRGGVELWEKINDKGHKMILEGELEDDEKKIEKGTMLMNKIDRGIWDEYVILSAKVIQTTLIAMGSSQQGPLRLDDIMTGFSKNFQVNMAVSKKPSFGDNEVVNFDD